MRILYVYLSGVWLGSILLVWEPDWPGIEEERGGVVLGGGPEVEVKVLELDSVP